MNTLRILSIVSAFLGFYTIAHHDALAAFICGGLSQFFLAEARILDVKKESRRLIDYLNKLIGEK